MDWGTIIFGVLALAFVVLIIQAIRQMAAPMEADEEDAAADGSASRPGGEEDEEKDEEKDEEDEQEDDDGEDEEVEAGPAGEPGDEDAPSAAGKPEPDRQARGRQPRKQVDRAEEARRLKQGLAKTRGGFIARLGSLFRGKRELDAGMLDQVEEILFTADIGVRTSQALIDSLRKRLGKQELTSAEAIWGHIKEQSTEILDQPGVGGLDLSRGRPFVILVIGVNGTGKTTTIGKLAARFKEEGHSVLLAAADTFRAAAVEQLEVWAERAGARVVKGKEGADPSSVIVEALKRAKSEQIDVVIADTAGRLHTKVDLMDELQKVRRSIAKWVDGAPHESVLVLDSTTGQNAIAQARMFKEAMDITGIILTKLDGTAKGGVVLGICHELQLPIRFVGIGEKVDDLREFDPQAFVEALYEGAESIAT